jgi:hypothetical protein
MANLSALDSTNATVYYDLDGLGTAVAPFTAKSPALLGSLTSATPAGPPASTSLSINALLRGIWQAIINLGTPPTLNDFNSMGLATAGAIKVTSGSLYLLAATNLNASTRYLQVHNTAATPASGATPLKSYPVYGGSGMLVLDLQFFGVSQASRGLFLSTGISWAMSTTPLTYTPATAAETIVEARWL